MLKIGTMITPATDPHKTNGKVLVVDDDNDIRDAICQILEYEGYDVQQAANGQEGIAQLKLDEVMPSLILLDLMMPVMNGWQFKAELEESPRFAKIPVVVLSADGNIQQRSENIGVSGYLKKPIQLDTLLTTVKHYCT